MVFKFFFLMLSLLTNDSLLFDLGVHLSNRETASCCTSDCMPYSNFAFFSFFLFVFIFKRLLLLIIFWPSSFSSYWVSSISVPFTRWCWPWSRIGIRFLFLFPLLFFSPRRIAVGLYIYLSTPLSLSLFMGVYSWVYIRPVRVFFFFSRRLLFLYLFFFFFLYGVSPSDWGGGEACGCINAAASLAAGCSLSENGVSLWRVGGLRLDLYFYKPQVKKRERERGGATWSICIIPFFLYGCVSFVCLIRLFPSSCWLLTFPCLHGASKKKEREAI